jgi:hypothetical protein
LSRSRPGRCSSLKQGSSKRDSDTPAGPVTKSEFEKNGRTPYPLPFEQGKKNADKSGVPGDDLDTDLNWNDIDNNSKSSFLKQAFEKDFLRKSSVYRDPAQHNSPERLTDFLKEPDTRQRFIKRCLIPTAVAFALGCLAYVLQVLPVGSV